MYFSDVDTAGQIRGGYGYDNELASMRALFVAHGPAFKRSQTVEPIQSVDVYNVIARILGQPPITPQSTQPS
jgi:hypothetical protein